ncbi:MAG: hypothetical protein HUU17_03865 [Chthonomonadales bacterium]|nr:hypothetical protein [Chthonomonadales bacterium]
MTFGDRQGKAIPVWRRVWGDSRPATARLLRLRRVDAAFGVGHGHGRVRHNSRAIRHEWRKPEFIRNPGFQFCAYRDTVQLGYQTRAFRDVGPMWHLA